MRKPLILSLCALSVLVVSVTDGSAKNKFTPKRTPDGRYISKGSLIDLPADIRERYIEVQCAAAADTFPLASYDFDDSGLPDPQGWVSIDRTAQLDTFFHVADGTELDGGDGGRLVPLEGLQSMWCGLTPSAQIPYCGWAALPGYGNDWDQMLMSKTLNCDSLHFSYKVYWDSEPGYDAAFVHYFDDAAQAWVELPVNGGMGLYDGEGTMTESLELASEITNGVTVLRFRFVSDASYSDEDGDWDTDGAVVVDSITVECYDDGQLTEAMYEDFEDESPGAKTTDDGGWTATVTAPFGVYAALHPGSQVLQEGWEPECVAPNFSHMWGFFDDPLNTNYGCGGHPQQGAIPYMNDDGLYMWNEVWSPLIPYAGVGSETILEYSIYEDGPFDPLVFPVWGVRSWVNGCPGEWRWHDFIYFVPRLGWSRSRWDVYSFVEPGATHIQIALGALDYCEVWCGIYGSDPCHSHAPLYDDVYLYRVDNAPPKINVSQENLFQDSFSEDGTTTGCARADMAADILPSNNPNILPGDSAVIDVRHPDGLATDPYTGVGPAVYAYVTVRQPGQPGKSGPDIEAPETRSIGKRYPLVDSLLHDSTWWYRFRMDTIRAYDGRVVSDRYAFDLRDDVFTPGDEVRYFFGAQGSNGIWGYWSMEYDGQGAPFVSEDITDALDNPCEFTILPAAGLIITGDILYVDAAVYWDGPAQLYFDSAFEMLGIDSRVDRYDVLAPTSNVNNSLASRVKNPTAQILDVYKTIIWNSGHVWTSGIGDGVSVKPNDCGLLFQFLDTYPADPGLYLSGDNLASDWITNLTGADAIALRSTYCSFGLIDDEHINAGEPTSPLLTATGDCFTGPPGGPDELIAYGGCPWINDFDVLIPTGLASTEFPYPNGSGDAVISQATPNSVGSTARVILSGFSYHYIRDPYPVFPPARVEHLQHILECLLNLHPRTSVDPTPQLGDYLEDNYPNPFNPTTTIRYGISERTLVWLKVYNVAGQLVKTLVSEVQSPRVDGFEIDWDGRGNDGQPLASGVYFYRLVTPGSSMTKKMVLLK